MTDTAARNTEQGHTPGPWREGQEGNIRVYGPDGMGEHSGLIAVVYKGRANACRIVACVNACEGIPTEALEGGVVKDMLEALRMIGAIINNGDDPPGSGFFDITEAEIEQVFAAITKATGGAA